MVLVVPAGVVLVGPAVGLTAGEVVPTAADKVAFAVDALVVSAAVVMLTAADVVAFAVGVLVVSAAAVVLTAAALVPVEIKVWDHLLFFPERPVPLDRLAPALFAWFPVEQQGSWD